MLQRLIGALLRFAHREGWLLKLADYFDPQGPVTVNMREGGDGFHSTN